MLVLPLSAAADDWARPRVKEVFSESRECFVRVIPGEGLRSASGHLATLDNWHSLGYGKVVAIYDARGKPIRAHELNELFDAREIERFPHSVSSIHWRKGAFYVRHDQTTLLATVKDGADFLFGLETGGFEYCEPHAGSFRCRDRRAPRQWTHVGRKLTR